MPLLIEWGILAGKVVGAKEKWMNPGDTKKSLPEQEKQRKRTANIRGGSRILRVKKMKETEQ